MAGQIDDEPRAFSTYDRAQLWNDGGGGGDNYSLACCQIGAREEEGES